MNTYLYVLDTLADWEPGFVTAELNSGRYFAEPGATRPVLTVGATRAPVRTMGGLTLVPDLTVDEVDPATAAILILPGATTWSAPEHRPVLDLAARFLTEGVPVAAICGATIALAESGLLDTRKHTSNDPHALAALAPSYQGTEHYVPAPVATDGDLITASGLAPLEFAHAILRKLDVLTPDALTAWHNLNTTRTAEHYFALMAAIPNPPNQHTTPTSTQQKPDSTPTPERPPVLNGTEERAHPCQTEPRLAHRAMRWRKKQEQQTPHPKPHPALPGARWGGAANPTLCQASKRPPSARWGGVVSLGVKEDP
ncbi:type 1 glutamine amidotransferase family protein [Actinokineospora iranica]|uniref:Putative intracellular protease/amidase n=1 Tax=Actinokineospora iranica TaxID=1271860 RepID=A0A1G6LM56_9PSEU|nr:type 1 glutamine amidotransferase family protein [Actinokineospora iranica]SDC44291.1 Putative intracellular protease/amidase [Actinokineospora iranica]